MKKIIFIAMLYVCAYSSFAYDDQRAGFEINVNGEQSPYRIFSTFVMPGSAVNITSAEAITVSTESMTAKSEGTRKWILQAPQQQGVFKATIANEKGKIIQINVLVLTPLSQLKGEYLNGYRIGKYPDRPLNGNPIYNAPKGLFEVTSENQSTQLSPHFTLRQFICKQAGDYPKYLIVRERLLLKLEHILERVNEKGYAIETFGFISGYRTPFYNKSIKNVQYSRHVYGGAADIFIDQNKDGHMDDLNKDGVTDEKDVRIFYNIVESEYEKDRYAKYVGGLGFYRQNSRHKGFIHVDVRGSRARW